MTVQRQFLKGKPANETHQLRVDVMFPQFRQPCLRPVTDRLSIVSVRTGLGPYSHKIQWQIQAS